MENCRALLADHNLLPGPQIGKGNFGVVYQSTDMTTHITYAVKILDLRMLRMRPMFMIDRLLREVKIMQHIDHPNIIKLFKTIQNNDTLVLVMELISGVDLFEMIIAKKGLREREAKPLYHQIASGLNYLHEKGIVHRDIKPENILLQGPNMGGNAETVVKIVDFGLSKEVFQDDAQSMVGTPRYVAPEVLQSASATNPLPLEQQERQLQEKFEATKSANDKKKSGKSTNVYGTAVDCYSAGVLLHVMLGSCFPQFEEKVCEQENCPMAPANTEGGGSRSHWHPQLIFKDERVMHLSPEAKDLISKLMTLDPKQRLTMRQAMEHQWFRSNGLRMPYSTPGVAAHSHKRSAEAISSDVAMYDAPTETQQRPHAPSLTHKPDVDANAGQKQNSTSFLQPDDGSSNSNSNIFPSQNQNNNNPTNLAAASELSAANNYQNVNVANTSEQPATTSAHPSQRSVLDPDSLMRLHVQIANCLQEAYMQYCDSDMDVASSIRSSSVASRSLMQSSQWLIKKLQQTSFSVMEMIPDLEVAVEQGELSMALVFFTTVKDWIKNLKTEANELLGRNVEVVTSVNQAIETAKRAAITHQAAKALESMTLSQKNVDDASLKADVMLDSSDSDMEEDRGKQTAEASFDKIVLGDTSKQSDVQNMKRALQMLKEIDRLLQEHMSFWSHMEVVIDVLMQRANHIEGMTNFTRNPKLKGRFIHRINEYTAMWQRVVILCDRFDQDKNRLQGGLYQFLHDKTA